jgi:hypothetical protein
MNGRHTESEQQNRKMEERKEEHNCPAAGGKNTDSGR